MAQYAVPSETLLPLVPGGTELDLHGERAYVSVVAFEFLDTAVRGVRIPGHVNFVEVNLRFYVRRLVDGEWRRGAVFVSELVPRRAIATVANVVYGEPYRVGRTSVSATPDRVEYAWSWRGARSRLAVDLGPTLGVPDPESHAGFIIEHYWGYTHRGAARTDEFEVTHPRWALREVRRAEIETDFARMYGERFAFLDGRAPDSVVFAEGSAVTVAPGQRMRVEKGRTDRHGPGTQ